MYYFRSFCIILNVLTLLYSDSYSGLLNTEPSLTPPWRIPLFCQGRSGKDKKSKCSSDMFLITFSLLPRLLCWSA